MYEKICVCEICKKILAQKSKPSDQDKDPIKFDIIPYLQSN